MSQDKASAESVEKQQGPDEAEVLQTDDQHAEVREESGTTAESSDELSEDQAEPLSEIDEVRLQLQEMTGKADQNMEAMLRTRAEMENLRKRQSRELENAHKYALDKIAVELLPVRDTLEMGVAAAATEAEMSKIVEGTELTLKMLTQALEKFNITEVDPVGDKFDPDLHQAISMQEGTDKPANTVLSVMQKGYTLNDRLLRPAMVIIAK